MSQCTDIDDVYCSVVLHSAVVLYYLQIYLSSATRILEALAPERDDEENVVGKRVSVSDGYHSS